MKRAGLYYLHIINSKSCTS